MTIKLTNKISKQSVIIDNTNAKSNADIIVGSTDPHLLIIFTQELRIVHDVNTLSEKEKVFVNSETNELEMFSDKYMKEIFIPSKQEFYDIEILSE